MWSVATQNKYLEEHEQHKVSLRPLILLTVLEVEKASQGHQKDQGNCWSEHPHPHVLHHTKKFQNSKEGGGGEQVNQADQPAAAEQDGEHRDEEREAQPLQYRQEVLETDYDPCWGQPERKE